MLQNFAARMVGRVNRNFLAGIGLLLISGAPQGWLRLVRGRQRWRRLPAPRPTPRENSVEKASSRSVLVYSAFVLPLVARITASGSEARLPPPSIATLRSVEASQKFRLASMLATFALARARAA